MESGEERRLVDIFSDWGLHEAAGRLRSELPAHLVPPEEEGEARVRAGLEVALRFRAPLIGRILLSQPTRALRVEAPAGVIAEVRLFDGQTLERWSEAILVQGDPEGDAVRRLAESENPVAGPLIGMITMSDGGHPLSPFVLYDGWHRAAAWYAHVRAGRIYPIAMDVIISRRRDPGWPTTLVPETAT
jgi:hypothetical protein